MKNTPAPANYTNITLRTREDSSQLTIPGISAGFRFQAGINTEIQLQDQLENKEDNPNLRLNLFYGRPECDRFSPKKRQFLREMDEKKAFNFTTNSLLIGPNEEIAEHNPSKLLSRSNFVKREFSKAYGRQSTGTTTGTTGTKGFELTSNKKNPKMSRFGQKVKAKNSLFGKSSPNRGFRKSKTFMGRGSSESSDPQEEEDGLIDIADFD